MSRYLDSRLDTSCLVTVIEGVSVIAPETEHDTADAETLDGAFAEAFRGSGPVVIDLDAFASVPPQGLLTIKRWALRLGAERRRFGVCTSSSTVKLAIASQGLASCLTMFGNLSSAMQSLRPGSRPPLGDILQQRFGVDRSKVLAALRRQRDEGGLLGQIMLVQRAIEPVTLMQALAAQQHASV